MKKITIICLLSIFAIASFAQSITVKIETTKGDITIMLYDETPVHRDNFVKLAESGFYEGLLFHRIIPNLCAGGDPQSKMLLLESIRQWWPWLYSTS